MLKKTFSILILACLSGLAIADEAIEPVLNELPPEVTKDGKIVSPENQVNGEKGEQKEDDKRPDPIAVQPPAGKVPASLAQLGDGTYFSKFAFLLDKSTRTLTIWERTPKGLKLAEAHPSDMGRRSGDKMILGDKKTPEGIYFFRTIYEANQLNFDEYGSRAYTMDYPNLFDQREKKTGSGIWLHAVPDRKSLYRGSRGCIVVRNDVITPLGKYVEVGKTPIVVEKKVEYISQDEYEVKQAQLANWLESWRKNWQEKNLEGYIEHYSSEFKSLGMDKPTWRRFKQSLNQKYEFIKVELAKPSILVHGDEMVIRFLQAYSSNTNSDFGEKVLYAKRDSDGEFRIIAERWSALPQKLYALLSNGRQTKTGF